MLHVRGRINRAWMGTRMSRSVLARLMPLVVAVSVALVCAE